jgi:predicted nucleotidyltransferase
MDADKIIVEFFRKKMPFVKGIYLFGSQADGTANSQSDYDVAFLNEHTVAKDSLRDFNLGLELGSLLKASVDLVDLQYASTDFRFIIVSTGERIYCADELFCDTFDMVSYSMYQSFEEERKSIFEEIKKQGSIYG